MKCYYKAQHGNQFVVIAGHDNRFKVSILLVAHLKFFQAGWDLAMALMKIRDGRTGKLGHSPTKHLSVWITSLTWVDLQFLSGQFPLTYLSTYVSFYAGDRDLYAAL